MDKKNQQKPIAVNVKTDTVLGSQYSQLVSVTVTDIDVTLQFAYIDPMDKTQGHVVARITLPRSTGEKLASLIQRIIKEHEAIKYKKN